MKNILFLLFGLLVSLTSCSVFSPVKTEQQNKYLLNTVPHSGIKSSHHSRTVWVTMPDTDAVYETTKMAYTIRPYQIAYFSQNRWAETPAEMLQPLIVQTLQNTHHFHAIMTRPFSGGYDYILNIQIQKLLQDYTRYQGLLFLTVRAQIIHATNNKVIATKEFSIVEDFNPKTPYNGVAAANEAAADMLRQLAAFCVRSI